MYIPFDWLFVLLQAPAAAPQGEEEFPVPTVQQEVLGNIRGQPVGLATVADLALPEPFLRRYADRIVLQSFEENFRVVIADEPESTSTPDAPPDAPKEGPDAAQAPAGGDAPKREPVVDTGGSWRIGLAVIGLALAAAVFVLRRKRA